MEINGTSAIVTGGASGIGEASARLLAAKGAKVVIADLNDEKGNALATELGGAFCHVDVTSVDEVIAAVETAKEMGPLRAVVNSAGIGAASRTIGKDGSYDSAFNLDYWRKVIDINLTGTFNVIRLAATAMSQTEPLADGERGAIVNMASVAAFDGQIGQAAYSASKGGVVGMTLPIARDLAVVGRAGQHHRPRPHRHADLRRGRGVGGVQGQPVQGRRLPEAPRLPGRAGQHGRGADHQLLHERPDDPGRRRRPPRAQVTSPAEVTSPVRVI